MAQLLKTCWKQARAFAVLRENPGSTSITCVVACNSLISRYRRFNTLIWPPTALSMPVVEMHAYMQTLMHTHKVKINKSSRMELAHEGYKIKI